MTTWRDILNSEVDPNSPVTSTLATALRDNPIAITEGAVGAPRNSLRSLTDLVAGDDVRSERTVTLDTGVGGSEFREAHSFGFIQIGTIRCVGSKSSGPAVPNIRIVRVRNGTSTTLVTGTDSVSLDVSVVPGDLIRFDAWATSSPGATYTLSFRTDGGDLWPGAAAIVSGNDVF